MKKRLMALGLVLSLALLGACAEDEDPGVDDDLDVTTTTLSDTGTTDTTLGDEDTTTTAP